MGQKHYREKLSRVSGKYAPMLLLLLPLLVPLLSSCESIFPKAVEQVEEQPQAHDSESGASVFVKGIETDDDLIVVDLLAINGAQKEIEISSQYNPIILEDGAGNQYKAAEKEIKLQPFTRNSLKIAFLGPLKDSNQELTLKINTPEILVQGIPANQSKRIEFAKYQPRQVNLRDTVFYHPNGMTITLKNIKFYSDETEVSFEAVNGFEQEVSLATYEWQQPFLEDEQGNKYSLIPASSSQLSIPARQTMSGTLRFAGQIPASARQLSLYFNENGSDSDRANQPKVVITNLAGPASEVAIALTESEEAENKDEAVNVSTSAVSSLPKEQTLNLQTNHADGSVLRLSKISFTEDYIETELTVTNGYRDEIQLNSSSNEMILRDDLGNTYYLAPPPQNPEIEIKSGETLKGNFRFLGRISPSAQTLTLVTNDGNQNYTSTSYPYITIASIPVNDAGEQINTAQNESSAPTTLPASQTVNLQTNHANGSVMQLRQISFGEDNIVLELAVTNGSDDEIRLNANRDMLLRDNLGNIYNLAPPSQNPEVKIAPGNTLRGNFVFLGRISPEATSLNLITNDKYGQTEDYARNPKMSVSNIAIASTNSEPTTAAKSEPEAKPPETQTQLPTTKKIDKQVNHPNGSVMRLSEASFAEDNIALQLAITNGHNYEIKLNNCKDTILRDNLGNVYNIAPPTQNPQLDVPPGETLSGKFVFLGRVSPEATSLTLTANSECGSDNENTTSPKMILADIPIQGK